MYLALIIKPIQPPNTTHSPFVIHPTVVVVGGAYPQCEPLCNVCYDRDADKFVGRYLAPINPDPISKRKQTDDSDPPAAKKSKKEAPAVLPRNLTGPLTLLCA